MLWFLKNWWYCFCLLFLAIQEVFNCTYFFHRILFISFWVSVLFPSMRENTSRILSFSFFLLSFPDALFFLFILKYIFITLKYVSVYVPVVEDIHICADTLGGLSHWSPWIWSTRWLRTFCMSIGNQTQVPWKISIHY